MQKTHKAKKSLGLKPINRFVRAKKSLGQNFLKSISALNKIIETGEISKKDLILEIGPGKGVLTKKLLEKADTVIAIEKDYELFRFLQEKFPEEIKNKKLILLNEDILEINIFNVVFNFCSGPRFSSQISSSKLEARPDHSQKLKLPQKLEGTSCNYKIIANIPYNITGAILKKFLTEKYQPKMMVLMVQNEVAKRIVAQDKKESLLSISVKAYGEPKIIMKVPARYFSPMPKVDSAIILIKNISREFFIQNKIIEKKFWEIVHSGFAHKRKKLSSNLKKYQLNSLQDLENKRAENLSLDDWKKFTEKIL